MRRLHALLLLVLLAACHAHAAAPARLPASCGAPATLSHALAAELAQGRAAEASPLGRCVADAARRGSIPAAMLLATTYRQAMVAATGAPASSSVLGLDLFGRHIGWLHIAAERGDPAAQLLMAQETDGAPYRPMPDWTLAWYQAAAENGNAPALTALASAYSQGRIGQERLYDFKKWLETRTNTAPAYRQMARLLASPSTVVLPR